MTKSQFTMNGEVFRVYPLGTCCCGCGGKTSIPKKSSAKKGILRGRPMKFIQWHHNSLPGPEHYQWNGGEKVDKRGYVWVYAPNHPRHSRYKVYEHTLIAERALGKFLPKGAVVHHHSPTELVVCQDNGYHLFLHQRTRAYRACGHANWLKCRFCQTYDAPENLNTTGDHKSCRNQHLASKR